MISQATEALMEEDKPEDVVAEGSAPKDSTVPEQVEYLSQVLMRMYFFADSYIFIRAARGVVRLAAGRQRGMYRLFNELNYPVQALYIKTTFCSFHVHLQEA